jgi:hypothetical protein
VAVATVAEGDWLVITGCEVEDIITGEDVFDIILSLFIFKHDNIILFFIYFLSFQIQSLKKK